MNIDKTNKRVRVVIATSVMLSFISFWRAAAIALNDLGSSAFYAGGISEQFVGKAAPWFILGVMLFSLAVRMLYIESSSMFTRGGVYRVVKEALGGTMAKVSSIPSRRRAHHRDVVRVALDRLERDLRGQSDVMLDFYKLEHEEEESTCGQDLKWDSKATARRFIER